MANLLSVSLAVLVGAALAKSVVVEAQDVPDGDTVVMLRPILTIAFAWQSAEFSFPYSHTSAQSADSLGPRFSLSEALAGIPGLEVQDRYNASLGDRLTIRGFGARTQFGVRGVRVLVDGVPATLADGQSTVDHLDLSTVRRVDVIRGPAAAVYGNASGGVIDFITAAGPSFAPDRRLSTRFGADGMLRVSGGLGGKVGNGRYSVDATRDSYDGFRQHSASDHSRLTAHFTKATASSMTEVSAFVVDFDAENPGSLDDAQVTADRNAARGFNVVQNASKDATQVLVGARWRSLGDGAALDFSLYGLVRTLDNPIPVRIIDLNRRAAGARTSIGATRGRLTWKLGASFDYQRDDRRNFGNNSGVRGPVVLDQLEQVFNVAPFGQIAVSLSDRVAGHVALRYDRIRFDANDRFGADGDDSGTRTMEALSPSAGVSYSITPRVIVYGNFSTAFETPTTTELANRVDGTGGLNRELDPQRTRSLEVGWRASFGSVGLDVAAYRAVVDDELIPFEAASTGRTFFRNAGSAVHRGVELALDARLTDLSLSASYTLQDIRFETFSVGSAVFDGNRVPGVTPHRVFLQARYRRGMWFASSQIKINGRLAVDDANLNFSPGYTIVDVRIGVGEIHMGHASVGAHLGINNVFDAEYNGSVTANAFGSRFFEPAPGRTLYTGLSISL